MLILLEPGSFVGGARGEWHTVFSEISLDSMAIVVADGSRADSGGEG